MEYHPSKLPQKMKDDLAALYISSRAWSTLETYVSYGREAERHFGQELGKLLPMPTAVLQEYLLHLIRKGKSASTLSGFIAAIGTFGTWLGYQRPAEESLRYIIEGRKRSLKKPPEKLRLLYFPLEQGLQDLFKAAY